MNDKHWILLLVILTAVYLLLEKKSYPVHPLSPTPEPRPQPQLEKSRQKIHVTVIHPNGCSTSTYFPVKVSKYNGEDEITIDYKSLITR